MLEDMSPETRRRALDVAWRLVMPAFGLQRQDDGDDGERVFLELDEELAVWRKLG